MIIFKKASDLKNFLKNSEFYPAKTGFVPTMGALHQGHLQLLEACKKQASLAIVSVFVNPTQFNDPSDFRNYPVTLEKDILLLEKAGCDILFLPPAEEVYDQGLDVQTHYELGSLETLLEGYFRPGHFQGVCNVMDKLLQIILPGHLFMGSKDYQQCMVIKRLIEIIRLNTRFHLVETVREADGLAMSSRNLRLTPEQRSKAAAIFRQFDFIAKNILLMPLHDLMQIAAGHLFKAGFHKVDYISVADPVTLAPLHSVVKGENFQVLIAAFIGKVRLIDNKCLTA
jgi:pantoate--beta-alanine ligase